MQPGSYQTIIIERVGVPHPENIKKTRLPISVDSNDSYLNGGQGIFGIAKLEFNLNIGDYVRFDFMYQLTNDMAEKYDEDGYQIGQAGWLALNGTRILTPNCPSVGENIVRLVHHQVTTRFANYTALYTGPHVFEIQVCGWGGVNTRLPSPTYAGDYLLVDKVHLAAEVYAAPIVV